MAPPRLLLADRIKSASDSFLAPLLPALRREFDVRFVSLPPGDALAQAIAEFDMVWLEWCWDHAVWATTTGVLQGRPTVLRLHSIEALQTDMPARVDWTQVSRLVLVGGDIGDVLAARFPRIADQVPIVQIANGIDPQRFVPGTPDRLRIGWVGHIEPKKNPALLLQIAHRLHQQDPRYRFHVAGPFTDFRTLRYVQRQLPALGLSDVVRFEGPIGDMPRWYADKGVLLSTSLYKSSAWRSAKRWRLARFPWCTIFPAPTACGPPNVCSRRSTTPWR